MILLPRHPTKIGPHLMPACRQSISKWFPNAYKPPDTETESPEELLKRKRSEFWTRTRLTFLMFLSFLTVIAVCFHPNQWTISSIAQIARNVPPVLLKLVFPTPLQCGHVWVLMLVVCIKVGMFKEILGVCLPLHSRREKSSHLIGPDSVPGFPLPSAQKSILLRIQACQIAARDGAPSSQECATR